MKDLEGWMLGYLVNALWQVPVLFMAAWGVVRVVRRAGSRTSARMEHRVWVMAMLLEVVLPACHVPVGEALRAGWLLAIGDGATAGGEVRTTVEAGLTHGTVALRLSEPLMWGIAGLYGCSVVYFAGRLAFGLWRTSRIERQAERVNLEAGAAAVWARCRERFGLTAPEMAVSARVSGPVTVGRELMLVPPGFLGRVGEGGLAAGDLEAVIAHEFAHMARRDFLKNLLYEAVSLPVMWHPVLWMTRSRVAESREMVCDAMAAEAVAGLGISARRMYARSLLRLAALVVQARPVRTYNAIGLFDANLFERRVMSLTEKRVEVRGVRRLGLFAACAVIGLGTCASALALRMEVAAPVAAVEAKGPARVSGGVMAGNNLTKVNPVYPPEAKEAKITGAVVLRAVIGKEGSIEKLEVVSGPEALRKSALDAVRQWTYKPYLLNGEPTEVDTTVTVNYSLSQ